MSTFWHQKDLKGLKHLWTVDRGKKQYLGYRRLGAPVVHSFPFISGFPYFKTEHWENGHPYQ